MEHETKNMEHPPAKREGILFILSAPSGAGKTSLGKELIDFFPELRQSISFTTRPMRPGEVDGRDYHFVTAETFETMIADGAFAEWAEVHGNRYGTALKTLEECRQKGEDVLLDIDCQGAAQIRKNFDGGVFVFILPPSYEELEKRLRGRNTDSEDVISHRMANARQEIPEAVWYDYILVNDDFSAAVERLKAIVLAEGCRASRVLPTVAEAFGL